MENTLLDREQLCAPAARTWLRVKVRRTSERTNSIPGVSSVRSTATIRNDSGLGAKRKKDERAESESEKRVKGKETRDNEKRERERKRVHCSGKNCAV